MKNRKGLLTGLIAVLAFVLVPTLSFAQDDAEQTFSIDPAHSSVLFRANHMDIGYVFGMFPEISGEFTFNKEDPSASSVNIEVQAGSVETFVDKRDKHLRSPDFLSAKEFSTITFESTDIEKADGKTYKVTGDFTIRDVTKEITIDVKHLGSGKGPEGNFRRGFYTEFDIDRTQFNVDWNPEVVGKKLRIILAFEGVVKN